MFPNSLDDHGKGTLIAILGVMVLSFDALLIRLASAPAWDIVFWRGALMGLSGATIPEHWTAPWAGRIGVNLAGYSELSLDDLVARTLAVARALEEARAA